MKESLTTKSYGINLSKHETKFHTCIQTLTEIVFTVSEHESFA